MKELSVEEKAKRYDEVSKEVKDFFEGKQKMYTDVTQTLEYLFPELKESEDERIRKGLIEYFLHYPDHEITYYALKADFVIAWLEKQGKNNMGISEATKKKLEDNLNKALEKETPESFNEFLDEQGEQKPTESMPEFKEGDILYNKDSCVSDSIFIFKGMSDKTNGYLCYARLYDKKDFIVYSKEDWDEGVGIYGGEFYPANHKQKELLFSEIEKAGYRWNPDEKKLKKIKQKPADTEKGTKGNDMEIPIPEPPLTIKHAREVMGIEQNPAWSEEDIVAIDCAVEVLSKDLPSLAASIERLKSLRPQYTWKPSDEQIEIVDMVLSNESMDDNVARILRDIREQLKKLKA